MSHRTDNPVNRPHRPRRLALVDADVNVHNRESAIRVFTQKLHRGVKGPGAVAPGLDLF
ncbi:MAG: hypothetical protein BWY57_02833 [Betaproteobacteria bacterium ADurb.Bin341]|jgi:hypothetical protein|nr:MAG: hypothetical protein BWY57_02833 [Betaproteobacteria bacterium ADurb.Bin341]